MNHNIIKNYTTEKGVPICLHENKFFKMMFNGYFHYLDSIKFHSSIAMVPMFENGDLLMVRLRRAPAIGFSLEFPRGGVDLNETTAQATIRELSEETGYKVNFSNISYLGKIGPDTATINTLTEVFKVIIPDDVYQSDYNDEAIDFPIRISVEEFKNKVRNGEIVDGITLASWALSIL